MDFFFSGIFWGSVLIIFGISMILRHILNIDIPVFRLLIGFLIVFAGIQILLGKPVFTGISNDETVMFQEREIRQFPTGKKNSEFSTIFAKSVIHITQDSIPAELEFLTLNTVFGGTEIIIDPSLNIQVKASAAFAGLTLPNETVLSFGKADYTVNGGAAKKLFLEVNGVFAGVFVKEGKL